MRFYRAIQRHFTLIFQQLHRHFLRQQRGWIPTARPTIPPTSSPATGDNESTDKPSRSPTRNPSLTPTNGPTISLAPSSDPTDVSELVVTYTESNSVKSNRIVKYSLIGFGGLFVPILLLGAYVVSVRGNEYKTSETDSVTKAWLLVIFSVLFAAGATEFVEILRNDT